MKTWETKAHQHQRSDHHYSHSIGHCSCGAEYRYVASLREGHGRHVLAAQGDRTTPLPEAAKRSAVRRSDFVTDWWNLYSPRSDGRAEGPWEHHAKLALLILQHPLTALVLPDAFKAVQNLDVPEYADAAVDRTLTEDEIRMFVPEYELEGD